MTSLDQACRLVLGLALSRPLGRHIDPLVLFLVSLFFRLVDGGGLVLGRAVDGVEDERVGAGVDELMLGACWHDDQVAGLDILVLARDGGFACTGREGEDLVHRMCLGRSVSGRGQCARQESLTSSPISPPTGTVMRTNCEYKPVHSTRRKSLDCDGRDVVI